MQDSNKINEIKKKLPRGSQALISQRTGLTPKTVGLILNGENTRLENRKKVFEEAEKIIKEYEGIIS